MVVRADIVLATPCQGSSVRVRACWFACAARVKVVALIRVVALDGVLADGAGVPDVLRVEDVAIAIGALHAGPVAGVEYPVSDLVRSPPNLVLVERIRVRLLECQGPTAVAILGVALRMRLEVEGRASQIDVPLAVVALPLAALFAGAVCLDIRRLSHPAAATPILPVVARSPEASSACRRAVAIASASQLLVLRLLLLLLLLHNGLGYCSHGGHEAEETDEPTRRGHLVLSWAGPLLLLSASLWQL
mmetsp:Transcript_49288/g.139785  ORF Transcript_49288/g.139785 Transcript_49288/m.139785 type:complete len:247 (-) Transcript_49288:31-771(-)